MQQKHATKKVILKHVGGAHVTNPIEVQYTLKKNNS